MKKIFSKFIALSIILALGSCAYVDDFIGNPDSDNDIKKLRFVDEYVIPDATVFENTIVGGLSGIDYAHGNWYMISDDPVSARFYTASISYNMDGFSAMDIQSVTTFKDNRGNNLNEGISDPEAIRYDDGYIVWTSEGNVNNGLSPFVSTASAQGMFQRETFLPDRYAPKPGNDDFGPRQNGVFEGLSLSVDGEGYWVAMELPLKEDGAAPTLEDTESPIRIAYINRATGNFGREIAYELGPVERPATNGTSFELNGVVEVLEYKDDKFLVLERSFSTGYEDGGNTVRIFDVDATKATDVQNIESLKGAEYTPVTKKLLFDFEEIRDQLTDGIVDNIEGITFGPDLGNGNKSLVLVADNNFSAFGPQLNQFILFEVLE
ncbi:MAG: esterase-like activity of phytase family protein [Bacteroidota bacterium]